MNVRALELSFGGIREVEKAWIEWFVTEHAQPYLQGRVLDFGCGLQPYREIVERAGGKYQGFDRADFPSNVSIEDVGDWELISEIGAWDAILCNQVAQYWPDPADVINIELAPLLRPGGHLVMTYPLTWSEIEPADLWRFTQAGMTRLLEQAGFQILVHEPRGEFDLGGFKLTLGYGVVAKLTARRAE